MGISLKQPFRFLAKLVGSGTAALERSTALSCRSFRKRRRVARTPVDGWRAAGPFAADLSDHSGVMLAEQRGRWSLAGGGSRALRTMLVADDANVALALAASGAGIAQLPDFAVAEALAAG